MILTYYINSTPTNSNYGNPSSRGEIALPDEFLDKYISAKGFVLPTIDNGVVVSLEVNQEALDAYNAEHPDRPEPIPEQPDNLIRDEQGNGYEQIIIDGKITLRCVEFADGSCNY